MDINTATQTASEIFTPFIATLKAVLIWFFTNPFGMVLVIGLIAGVIGYVFRKLHGTAGGRT